MNARVLVIDDQPASIDVLRASLTTFVPGVEILTASSGEEGLCAARDELPDLVLLDAMMPVMDGFEVCQELKTDPVTASIPVLMVSGAMTDTSARVRGLEVGAEGYICKPFAIPELIAQIKTLVRLKRTTDALRDRERDLEKELALRTGALRESEQKFRSLFDQLPDAILVCDERGRVLDANPTARQLSGVCRGALIGTPVNDLFAPSDREAAGSKFPGWFRGESEFTDGLNWQKNGHPLPVQIHSTRIQYLGDTAAVVLQVRDLTEHKRLQEQFHQAQKMEAVGRLADGIAHDFNNLLTSILSFGQLVLDDLGSDHPVAVNAREIIHTAERAGELSQQLLTFSRRQVIQRTPQDLNGIVRDMDRMLRRTLGEDVELVCLLADGLPVVEADATRLGQVIMNLAVNARDAMPTGGRLAIQTRSVTLTPQDCAQLPDVEPGPFVVLSISDTGCGMTPEVMEHLFEPFFTTKEDEGGTGLGLSTTYGIAKQFGGHIQVDSQPGVGTTFRVYLPESEGEPAAPKSRPGGKAPARGGETLLLVEDEPSLRDVTAQILRRLGYKVYTASGGTEALDLARKRRDDIQLLLTDMIMPGMDGWTLARTLREEDPELRVVFISGYSDGFITRHGIQEESIDLLPKPFRRDALARKIREVLDRPR